jgi:glycosyltransferase involved in cell wall biosynthesis
MNQTPAAELDILIPVYNEGENIGRVLESLRQHVKTPFCVLICYDRDDDDTLPVAEAFARQGMSIRFVKNRGRGAFGAVVTGFADSAAPAVLVFPGDDDYNAPRLDAMVARFREGCDIVAASRFMPGGCMERCPWLKAAIVRASAFVLHHAARLPTRDPSNGFRLFSQRVIREIPLESSAGFAYSIELLVKCHRLGWRIGEVPVAWYERKAGQSRFQVIRWLPIYWRWFRYAFETTYLRRGPEAVRTGAGTAASTR